MNYIYSKCPSKPKQYNWKALEQIDFIDIYYNLKNLRYIFTVGGGLESNTPAYVKLPNNLL